MRALSAWAPMMLLTLAGCAPGLAADADNQDKSAIAATVNGEPIEVSEVNATVAVVLQGRNAGAELPSIQAEALAQLVDRHLVESVLVADGYKVDEEEIDAAIEQVKAQIVQQKISLEQGLAQHGMSPETLRPRLVWQRLWQQYVEKYLNDAALEAHFNTHREDFDGTQVRVSHILLRPDRSNDPKSVAAKQKAAATIREQIEKQEISFAEAAKKFSAGPSRHQGGDLGLIPRHGVMVEPFSQAAFALKKGQISPPVVTPFGVHLIVVTEIKPGEIEWSDVREHLQAPAAHELFLKLAEKQRKKAKIEFTGTLQHFKPGTKELVPSGKGQQ